MIRRPPRSTRKESSAASDVYKRQDESSVWAFVSMWEGVLKGSFICKGDLLKPASYKTPAKHSRGNIFDGTDKWEFFGPKYL